MPSARIAAGEKRWGAGLWKASGLNKAQITKHFPQSQDVTVVVPTLPQN